MPNKKPADPPEDKALVQKIDSMMNRDTPSQTDKSAKTAPEVDPKLLKAVGIPKTNSVEAPQVSKEPPETPETSETPETPEPINQEEQPLPPAQIDDTVSDKAVDEIVATEADTVLAVEDAAQQHTTAEPKQSSRGWKAKLKAIVRNKRFWAAVVVLLVVLGAVPFTRYSIAGLFYKPNIAITITDSKTNTPVSNATISFGGAQAKTNGEGKVTFRAKPGKHHLEVEKQYYKASDDQYFVGFSGAQTKRQLVATGRQVPITVINKITGQPVSGAEITVLKTNAKTDKRGKAILVLPANAVSNSGKISLKGFNAATVAIKVTDQVATENTFKVTPTGHVYFLSNLGGTIDVVKANLDGSGRHTVLEGTGKEDARTTSLLAARDWRYAVLKARRDTAQPSLYLIDTANDKITQFESGDAEFNLVGWYNHNFIYHSIRNTVPTSQTGHEVLKSYNAELAQLNQLDQTQAEGSATNYLYQAFYNFYIVDGAVVYNAQWSAYSADGSTPNFAGKNTTIRSVGASGQGKKDYQSFDSAATGYIDAILYEPQGVYYGVYSNQANKTTYYEYENQAATPASDISANDFNRSYPTYLISPSANKTFWADPRDGKNTLFIGDEKAGNKQQIASLSDYKAYGWFSDNYLLVSKNDSELYILPVGKFASKEPLKITNYYKPTQTYAGYGYGYGGL